MIPGSETTPPPKPRKPRASGDDPSMTAWAAEKIP